MTQTDHWNAARYDSAARFVSDLGAPVLELLNPQPGERILDVGCGDGALTTHIARAGANVEGVDASADMVAAARVRGVDARVADCQALTFEGDFDAVFSNAALHWMTKPEAVISGVYRALRPGGRFVAEFGGLGNVAAIRTAMVAALAELGRDEDLRDVWYYPSVAEHRAKLEAGGFTVTEITLIPRPTPVETGLRVWIETLAAPVVAKVDPADRAAFLDRTVALVEPALRDGQGHWTADYVRLRFRAVRP
ncbi:MAG: methyltransferase domain-containing protein [Pseudomonadota bacterium]